MKGRFNYPDLDVLESPLMSSAPFTAVFSSIPGSAIAERIFNDPESWGDDDEDEGDFPEDVDLEQMTWLTEELEKVIGKTGIEVVDSKTSTLAPPTASALPMRLKRDGTISWKGKALGKRGAVRPISLAALFEHTTEDFSGEIQQQLSKILESGGIPHHIRYPPHSSALSPPSTSDTSSTLDSPLQIQTASSAGTGGEKSPSPVTIYSASATLSFLEWYGIYPDSPRLDLNAMRAMQPKSARLKGPPTLQIPSPRRPSRPTSILGTPMEQTPVARQAKRRSSSVPPPGLAAPENLQPQMRPPTSPARTPTPPAVPARSVSPDSYQHPQAKAPVANAPAADGRAADVRAADVRAADVRAADVRAADAPVADAPAADAPAPTPNLTLAAPASTKRGRSLAAPPPPPPPYVQTLQRSDSAPSLRRRLPSIPPTSTSASSSRSVTPPVVAPIATQALDAPRTGSPQAVRTPSSTTAVSQSPHTLARPLPAPRAQSGPAGPRTRVRGRDSSAPCTFAGAQRPAGLRL